MAGWWYFANISIFSFPVRYLKVGCVGAGGQVRGFTSSQGWTLSEFCQNICLAGNRQYSARQPRLSPVLPCFWLLAGMPGCDWSEGRVPSPWDQYEETRGGHQGGPATTRTDFWRLRVHSRYPGLVTDYRIIQSPISTQMTNVVNNLLNDNILWSWPVC